MFQRILLAMLISALTAAWPAAADWPMWRFDPGRTAAGTEELPSPEELSLAWERGYAPREMVWDDPLNHDLMPFDRVFEPVVHRGVMVIGFNDRDKVVGLSAETGSVKWTFHAGGPVRMAPAAWSGRVFFTSDDGMLYCLDIDNGKLLWKKRGGPDGRRILGNKRLVSAWPARGGVVVRDGTVYWAAGIWPFMGTYIYATNGETGETLWLNDGTGSTYILQPHNSPAFAGVAPQGNFAVSGDKLLVPGGRSVPAAYDISTGELLYYRLADNGKNGGAFVCANEHIFFNHNRERRVHVFSSDNGDLLDRDPGKYPVLNGNRVYYSGPTVKIADVSAPAEIIEEVNADADGDLIMAGSRLYAAGNKGITVLEPKAAGKTKIIGFIPVRGGVERLLAAEQSLFAVSIDGTIRAFNASAENPTLYREHPEPLTISPETLSLAEGILHSTGKESGWALVYGAGDGGLPAALHRRSSLDIIVIEGDREKASALRKQYDLAGIPAGKVAFISSSAADAGLPPYLASLSVIVDDTALDGLDSQRTIGLVHHSMRPFGGALWITESAPRSSRLFAAASLPDFEGLSLEPASGLNASYYLRSGAPQGSANWTQQYGSMANTVKSDDGLVRLPLGVLWFGGNSNMDVLPRHGHGPPEQVVDGNLIIQGMDSISCRDVYTGRVVWKTEFDTLGSFNQYYDESYADLPFANTYYNQEHLPGANSRGTNFVVTPEEVFVAQGTHIHIIDIKDGRIKKSVKNESNARVGFIGIYQGQLIAGTEFASYSGMVSAPATKTAGLQPITPGNDRRVKRFTDYDITASAGLALYDSEERLLWHRPAESGFIHNSITAGNNRLYLIDAVPPAMKNTLSRRGINISQHSVLMAIDPGSGEIIWSREKDVFGSWLGYSEEHDLLLQSTRPSRDMISGEEGTRMIVHDAATGKILWDREMKYANPPIIHGDRIIVESRGFSLMTGEPLVRVNPITGEEQEWTYTREYGCNYNIASEHLLSFRSAAAGFYDLDNKGGTGNFGGFKSGCTANMIAANGVLNAPDYTRTCSCSYQNQTSLALVHMPEMEYWTTNDFDWTGADVRRLGLNLGAPGDRMGDDGTLWLDFPSVGGPSPEIPTAMKEAEAVRSLTRNSLRIRDGSHPWVSSSSLEGLSELEIRLVDELRPDLEYLVTLFFAELQEDTAPGERVFDVVLQGKMIYKNLDIVREAGDVMKEVSISASRVKSRKGLLHLSLEPRDGSRPPIISGIRIEQSDESQPTFSMAGAMR